MDGAKVNCNKKLENWCEMVLILRSFLHVKVAQAEQSKGADGHQAYSTALGAGEYQEEDNKLQIVTRQSAVTAQMASTQSTLTVHMAIRESTATVQWPSRRAQLKRRCLSGRLHVQCRKPSKKVCIGRVQMTIRHSTARVQIVAMHLSVLY
jgi:hypothetical protein